MHSVASPMKGRRYLTPPIENASLATFTFLSKRKDTLRNMLFNIISDDNALFSVGIGINRTNFVHGAMMKVFLQPYLRFWTRFLDQILILLEDGANVI